MLDDLWTRLFYRVAALFRRRGQKRSAELIGYSLGPGSNEITISWEQGDGDKAGELAVLNEDADHVQVRILYEYFTGLRLLVAYPRESVALLKEPLGSRRVLDDAGNEVQRVTR